MAIRYYIGLDLGREQDHTAWAVMEMRISHWHKSGKYVLHPGDFWEKDVEYDNYKHELGLVELSQIPLHTPWQKIAQELEDSIGRCLQKDERAEIRLWIDASGIGDPIIEGFIEPVVFKHDIWPYPVRIVPGEAGYNRDTRTVSKIFLIDNAMVMREKKEFVIAKALQNTPVMDLFEKQIQDFRRKEGKRAGTILYEAVQGEHDDLVIAFALCCLGANYEGTGIYDTWVIDLDDEEDDDESNW